ncbi:MAG: hypothetical protein NZM04_06475 [Methylacidiphilales bacterium]|nr:hypothetical protein [Candidatus Methylacidiphilales bacterium]MDW8349418.1 hypothetical protein [Verrucomicrobiae bacterium]
MKTFILIALAAFLTIGCATTAEKTSDRCKKCCGDNCEACCKGKCEDCCGK